ncbi:hypothetical protein DLM78_07510 [Leptospira stimsonii]|uniref:Uncharacterized protein n=1 Tax=Leptospira stimsonii TaxID=2202203 RepID=A0A8B3CVQ1_9LEPT|nr:hypothetical protein DLM78_07510 [Leptospira stimsonii]
MFRAIGSERVSSKASGLSRSRRMGTRRSEKLFFNYPLTYKNARELSISNARNKGRDRSFRFSDILIAEKNPVGSIVPFKERI